MHIAVASGKGGTGKTTVATSLALSLKATGTLVLDCDVEAPNAHLFLKPTFEWRKEVGILIPLVNETQSAGYKAVRWDGKNNFGERLPSGIYIYRLAAGNSMESKKMLFVK